MEENTIYNPLVSIVVITYNSSQFVLETLESAKAQTYKNIELIVSDDCSTDDTVEVCKNWLENNNDRFVRSQIITANKNTGVSANCNRGVKEAKGEWIKMIAGDDMLLSNCIKDNINFVSESKASFIFSRMRLTKKNSEIEFYFQETRLLNKLENQIDLIIGKNILPAPTSFINRLALLKLKGFDNRFPMLEDYPLWVKALKNGFQFNFLDKETVVYRIHPNSTTTSSNTDSEYIYDNYKFLQSVYKFKLLVLFFEQIKQNQLRIAWRNLISCLQFFSIIMLGNKNNKFNKVIYKSFFLLRASFYHNSFKNKYYLKSRK